MLAYQMVLKGRKMSKSGKGAKKGENRFKSSQEAKVKARLERVKEVVLPKIMAILDFTHFKNKTKFQEMCAEIFNENLPTNMNRISRRTIANKPYWYELGSVYYEHYSNGKNDDLEKIKTKALTSYHNAEIKEGIEQKIKHLTFQNEALTKALGEAKLSKKNIETEESLEKLKQDIDDLICVIDFLIKATDGIVEVDKENYTIINMADDLNGKLPKQFAKVYFKHLGYEI